MHSNSTARGPTAEQEANDNAEQADRCRRLARATYDRTTSAMLEQMAADFDQRSEQRSA